MGIFNKYSTSGVAGPDVVGIGVSGLAFDFRKEDWHTSILTGLSWVSGDPSMLEFDLGIRHYFRDAEIFKPYLSAGFDSMTVNLSCPQNSPACNNLSGSTSRGLFGDAGFLWRYNSGFNIGYNFKFSLNGNADLIQQGLTLGWGW